MKLLHMELSKICSRKILWVGITAVALFFIAWQTAYISEKKVWDNGVMYKGLEALQKDRELAKEYEGIFTWETAKKIIEKYGFSSYEDYEGLTNKNFCNQFVTRYMTEYGYTGEGEPQLRVSPDNNYAVDIVIKEGVRFGYIGGFEDLREAMAMLIPCITILLIIAVAPVFSEEYMLRTAAVALSTVRGKKKDIWTKIGAALVFSCILYVVFVTFLYIAYLCVYGRDGLDAGASLMLIGVQIESGMSIRAWFIRYFLAGLLSVMVQTCMTLFVSARSRQNFTAVILSTVLYLMPLVLGQGVFKLFAPTRLQMILVNICLWFPFYSAHMLKGLPFLDRLKAPFIILLIAASLYLAYRKYRDYQAE